MEQIAKRSEARDTSPMEQALNELRSAHDRMGDQVEIALKTFSPVLKPVPPPAPSSVTSGQPIDPMDSDLVAIIRQAARFMHNKADDLMEINSRSTL